VSSIRSHLSYANVVATLALVFAMSGGALAARHYLITSTRQIKPSVLKKLQGRSGKTGAAGPQGNEGSPGKEGPPGTPGLSALSNLPSGSSESGEFAAESTLASTGEGIDEAVSFSIPLATNATAVYTTKGSAPHCNGRGHADPGYLCVYSSNTNNLSETSIAECETTSPFCSGTNNIAGHWGFIITWEAKGAGAANAVGSWTITAG
jgi:hypothetical protein